MQKKSLIETVEERRETEKEDERIRLELSEKLNLWRTQGWNVSRLEPVLKREIEVAKKEFENYEKNMNRMLLLAEKLRMLDTRQLRDALCSIRTGLADTEKELSELAGHSLLFKRQLRAIRTKIEATRKNMFDLANRGYAQRFVEQFRNIQTKIDILCDELSELETRGDPQLFKLRHRDIRAKLNMVEKDLSEFVMRIVPPELEPQLTILTAQLNDPYAADELEKTLCELEEKFELKKEEKQKLATAPEVSGELSTVLTRLAHVIEGLKVGAAVTAAMPQNTQLPSQTSFGPEVWDRTDASSEMWLIHLRTLDTQSLKLELPAENVRTKKSYKILARLLMENDEARRVFKRVAPLRKLRALNVLSDLFASTDLRLSKSDTDWQYLEAELNFLETGRMEREPRVTEWVIPTGSGEVRVRRYTVDAETIGYIVEKGG